MIVGCILAVIALLAVSVVVFINQPSFGRTPRGERLERVMKSPNYRDGGYDTHYAEIGNRFPNIDLAILENGQYDKEWSLIHLMPQYMAQTACFVPEIGRSLLFLIRCQYKRISPGKGKKEGKITGIQKVSDSHYPFHPYFFIHLQRSLPQKASGWRGRDVYIEKTFTSVCHLCSKLRKL